MPPRKTRVAAAKAAEAISTKSPPGNKPVKQAKASSPKPRQRKTADTSKAASTIGKKGKGAGKKTSETPKRKVTPPKVVPERKIQETQTPETIDLISDGSDNEAGQSTLDTPFASARENTLATPTTVGVPTTPGVPPSTLIEPGLQLMDEQQADLRFGHRCIPWEYEAYSWRHWHDRGTVTFHGQQYVFASNHAGQDEVSGDCLFRALARLLTGSGSHHLFVRAEHERFWNTYDEANRDLLLIIGTDGALENYEALSVLDSLPGKGQRTLKARLARAGTWQHLEILEITALLYRVQVIVFDDSARPGNAAEDRIGHRPPKDVTVRSFGARNRTQLLLRFTGPRGGNHFQPMFADIERPEEYRCELLDHLDVRDPLRHFQYRSTQSRKGPPSEVPLPFIWRPTPVLTIGDVSRLTGRRVVTLSSKPVRNN